MARPLRILIPDGVYHVTSRGLERRRIVRDDADRNRWIEALDAVASRRDWHVLAWALMDNHYHLFLQTPHADLSVGMHDLNSGYVSYFNRRHKRKGPLLEGRFKALLVEREHHYWELSRYIHLNPVRAGIVARPEQYRWSSCRYYLGDRPAPAWLAWEDVLASHGTSLRAARRSYAGFLAEGIGGGLGSPLADAKAGILLGSADFVRRLQEWLGDRPLDPNVPAARRLSASIEVKIEDLVCRSFGTDPASLRTRNERRNDARSAAIYLCRKLTRTTVSEMAARFGGVRESAISNTVSRTKLRRTQDKHFDRLLARLERALREGEM